MCTKIINYGNYYFTENQQLNKDLPDHLAEELLEYVEFLVYKFHKDENLSDDQKKGYSKRLGRHKIW